MVLRKRKKKDYAAMSNIGRRSKVVKPHQPIYKQKLEETQLEDNSDLYNFESDSEQPSMKKKLKKSDNSTSFQRYLKGISRNMNKMRKNKAPAINNKLNEHKAINDRIESVNTVDNANTDNESVNDIPPINNNDDNESIGDASYLV